MPVLIVTSELRMQPVAVIGGAADVHSSAPIMNAVDGVQMTAFV